MVTIIGGIRLVDALKAEGIELPPNCADIELVMPVDGVIVLKYIELMTDDRLAKLGRALTRLAEQR